eukprot:909678-Prorocentrum_minimum.AAC.1
MLEGRGVMLEGVSTRFERRGGMSEGRVGIDDRSAAGWAWHDGKRKAPAGAGGQTVLTFFRAQSLSNR